MMVEKIGRAAMLELLAEESAELLQAALKMARIMRGENPTPVTRMQAEKNLIEEYTDVRLCAKDLGLRKDSATARAKLQRFQRRWDEKEKLVDGK